MPTVALNVYRKYTINVLKYGKHKIYINNCIYKLLGKKQLRVNGAKRNVSRVLVVIALQSMQLLITVQRLENAMLECLHNHMVCLLL